MLWNWGFILGSATEAVRVSFKDWMTSRMWERKKERKKKINPPFPTTKKNCELGTFSLAGRQKLVWHREWVPPLIPGFYWIPLGCIVVGTMSKEFFWRTSFSSVFNLPLICSSEDWMANLINLMFIQNKHLTTGIVKRRREEYWWKILYCVIISDRKIYLTTCL